ncbi:hypothetical protein [Flavobacterium sp. N1994]|uniref:hypothetical protein n=1 Tax=Flavobacterium sp. N1994 TaxID=2986827 RepID=UPI00222313F9|nr:hypothetical protein [Flavobacterium sp. N1994]
MKTIDKKVYLMERISALEIQQTAELHLLKKQFHSTIEQLNPLYFLKNTISGIIGSPDIKSDLLHGTINMASNFIEKNTVLGVFQKPIKKILGNLTMTLLNKLSPKKEL